MSRYGRLQKCTGANQHGAVAERPLNAVHRLRRTVRPLSFGTASFRVVDGVRHTSPAPTATCLAIHDRDRSGRPREVWIFAIPVRPGALLPRESRERVTFGPTVGRPQFAPLRRTGPPGPVRSRKAMG